MAILTRIHSYIDAFAGNNDAQQIVTRIRHPGRCRRAPGRVTSVERALQRDAMLVAVGARELPPKNGFEAGPSESRDRGASTEGDAE